MQLEGDILAAWLRARCGKLTSSNMVLAMKYLKDGKTPSADRTTLQKEILAERLTQQNVRHFVNDAMQWGLDTEDEARAAYQAETGQFVDLFPGEFYDHPVIDNCGASIDGRVGAKGLVEIKCPTTPTMIDWLMAGEVPEKHKPQMTMELVCSGREWCDFVAYDPRITIPSKRLLILRYVPTHDELELVHEEAVKFLKEVDKMFDIMVGVNG